MVDFTLSPALNVDSLADMFGRSGRLQIGGFLEHSCAAALLRELIESRQWKLAANRGEQVIDFSQEMLARWSPDQHAKLRKAVEAGGRYGFQFCYETIRLPKVDDATAAPTLLAQFARFLSSPELVEFMRRLTGFDDIAFADAHASRYRPGHFLTGHDDKADLMHRRAAYVLGLTPEWRPDWGGLLLFHDSQGNVMRGYAPAFNTLNIFAVPQPHSVSWVNQLAGAPRYSVTGWLRAGEPG